MEKTFKMGKIVNTHGVKGEIKIYPYTDDPYKLDVLKYILIEGQGDQKFKLTSFRLHKNMILTKIKGINDINDVTQYLQKEIFVYRSDVEAIDDDEGHYIVDLIGCEIVDENETIVGILMDVLQNTAQDLYEVKTPDGKVFLIPVVDAFVDRIEIDQRKIYVKMIEGLLE